MVIQESFVTRKPLEFTLIVLLIVLLILLPVYFITKEQKTAPQEVLVAETYDEVNYWFNIESELSDSDKRHLFQLNYENNFIQWTGDIVACDRLAPLYRVSVDHSGDGRADVIFTTDNDCKGIPLGKRIVYQTRLIDLKVFIFIGKDGEIVNWEA
jgi:hypothetical protein